jgi:hypothetical protein
MRLSPRLGSVSVVCMALGVACQPCIDGYEPQADGACVVVVTTQAERDTSENVGPNAQLETVEVLGEVIPGTLDLDGIAALEVQVWSGADMTLYGPDLAGARPFSRTTLDLDGLDAGQTDAFSFIVSAAGGRGTSVYVYAAAELEGGGHFLVAAQQVPYRVEDDGLDEPVQVVLDADQVL